MNADLHPNAELTGRGLKDLNKDYNRAPVERTVRLGGLDVR